MGTMRTGSRSTATVALLLVLAVLAAACGSRLSDEERALALAASSGSTGTATTTPGAATDPDDEGTDPAAGLPGAPTTSAAPRGGAGGGGTPGAEADDDQPPPEAGDEAGDGEAEGAGVAVCLPSGDGGPGVTPTELRFGNVSTLSGPIPGFGRTGVNGVQAYFNMVNAHGGVCGRQLTLVRGDDRLQAATNRSETEKLAGQVLAFVGNTTVVDDGGTPVIEAAGIPDVSLAIAESRIRSSFNFSPNPIDLSTGAGNGARDIMRYFRDEFGVQTAAIVYPAQASARNRALAYRDDFAANGIEVLHEFEVAVTETNFTSQVNTMANSDVDLVITTLEVNGMARLASTFAQRQFFPTVPFYGAQAYGQTFLQLAGSAAEGTRIGVAYAIPENAASNPAIAAFDEWYARSNPGQDVDFFAIMGWIAADMLVTALLGTGPAPTRESLLAQLRTLDSYDGNGLIGTIDPVNKGTARCFAVLEVRDGQWVQTFPGQGFQC